MDAAITTQLCVGLVNSQSSGLGGGFFMVTYSAESGTSEFLDARETAPSAADEAYVAFHLNSSYNYGIYYQCNTKINSLLRLFVYY